MALTILQEPTSPNVSNTNLIYTVSSSNVPQFQFRYIADLYESGSATRLARFKYPQNSSGTANIDLARPIGDYLDTDYNWTTVAQEDTDLYKTFIIEFGEEYGTSYNSSVTTFTNEASSTIDVLKGNIQYPSVGGFDFTNKIRTDQTSSINFNYEPYVFSSDINEPVSYWSATILSNDPRQLNTLVQSKYFVNGDGLTDVYVAKPTSLDDYGTISRLYQGDKNIPDSVSLKIYDDSATEIWDSLPIADTANQDRSLINSDNLTTLNSGSLTLGNGLANFKDSLAITAKTSSYGTDTLENTISSSAQWNYVIISYGDSSREPFQLFYNEDKGPDVLDTLSYPSFVPLLKTNYYTTKCNNEKTRFAFINSFGAWDYYNVYMPTRRVTNIDRKIYEQDRINLNDRIATYNVSNRGETQYYTEYTDEFEITTDVIDSQESQWLREMFESSEVFIQSGSDFIPINILNTSEAIINTTARNKQFQYTIRYQFSNLREPR